MTSVNGFQHDRFNGFRATHNARNAGNPCDQAIVATIAGLNAAACCFVISEGVSKTFDNLLFDGDHTLSFARPTNDTGVCEYILALTNPIRVQHGTILEVTPGGETCGNEDRRDALSGTTLVIRYDTVNQKVKTISLQGSISFVAGLPNVYNFFSAGSLDEDLGVAIANQLTECRELPATGGFAFSLTPGGTVEVNLAEV